MRVPILYSIIFLTLLSSCGSSEKDTRVTPQTLLTEISEQRRFANTDQLAGWLIQKDPSLLLVDVRSHEEFSAYTLPGAINVPLANLLSPEEQARLDCEKHRIVFFANGSVLAEKAWVINRRLGCASAQVLKGGLNEWTATILAPKAPPVTASMEEFDLYQFRKAASLYFSGGSRSLEPENFVEPPKETAAPAPQAKKSVPLQQKKVEVQAEEEEGC
jgi:rhodanese-related sulfurtransferase